MDPFTLALIGTSALSGISSILGGFGTSAQAAAQAQQAKIDAGIAQTKSVEIGEQSQLQLRQTLGNLNALQTARGVSADSPTAMAAENYTTQQSDRQEGIQRLGALQQAQGYEDQAAGYQKQSDFAIPLAIMGGGAQAAGGIAKALQFAG